MFSDEREYDDDGNQVNWYDQLKRITKGAELFTVKALVAPPNHEDSAWVTIGTITLTTDLFTSQFGDDRLFFEHARLTQDRDFWPEDWLVFDRGNDPKFDQTEEFIWGTHVPEGVWPDNDAEAKAFYMEQQRTYGCPFQWLLDSLSA